MGLSKIVAYLSTALLLLIGFQNCGSTESGTSGEHIVSDTPTPLSKSIAQLSIPLSSASFNPRAELRPDGTVINLETGKPVAIDATLAADIRQQLNSAELCDYNVGPLPPGTVTCTAMPLPHAFALTDSGEEVPLAIPICHNDTTDLCQSSRLAFRDLVQRIQSAIAAP